MDTKLTTLSQQAVERDVESHEDVYVRHVDDRSLAALQVLAEQMTGSAAEALGPAFIP